MQTVLENPRNGCALHGALQTVEEIRGVVPIVHANAGCAAANARANQSSGMNSAFWNAWSVPGTNVQERHVIFGGASRLREQIKNTRKVIDGKLYVVLNSCESAMVGDDVEAMAKEAREQGGPVIATLSAGFNGGVHSGYEHVLTDIFRMIGQNDSREELSDLRDGKLVNIFGILPGKDLYYRGDLEEIKRILAGIGLRANIFFGAVDGVDELLAAPRAALSLTFSKWGLLPAEQLKEDYGIPVLSFPSVPAGIRQVQSFVRRLTEELGLDGHKTDAFLHKEELEFYYFLHSAADLICREHPDRRVSIVADESNFIRFASLLSDYLGVSIQDAVITDFYPNEGRTVSEKESELTSYAEAVYFSQDGGEIAGIISLQDADFLLGSSLEKQAAGEAGLPLLLVSYPVFHQTFLNKSYAGIRGALTFMEDYLTAVQAHNAKEEDDRNLLIRQSQAS